MVKFNDIRRLLRTGKNAQNLTLRAFGSDLEGAAADFAVGGEALVGDARIDRDVKRLAAVRALDGSEFFHQRNVAGKGAGVQLGAIGMTNGGGICDLRMTINGAVVGLEL